MKQENIMTQWYKKTFGKNNVCGGKFINMKDYWTSQKNKNYFIYMNYLSQYN